MNKKDKPLILIRNYEPEDVQDLASIYYNTIHEVNSDDYNEEQLNAWAPKSSRNSDRWLKKFAKTKPLVAISQGKIVGFAELLHTGYIDCFYVHHQWNRQGVGAALMKAIHSEALEQKIGRLFANVSITAKPFFEKHGFIVDTKQTVSLNNVDFINYKMEKHLDHVANPVA
ncbi:MAG: GNAT family N-acetyltransferase [Chlamydiota bacterium]|nr:GNAT family N-acetyltransferase [Chlamydiota bacterium]